MKKFLNSKLFIAIIMIIAMLAVMSACTPEEEENTPPAITLPEFSIDFVDGEDTITVTNTAFANVELVVFSNESKSVTTFYKGIKVSTFVAGISELDNKTEITSLLVIAEDGYGDEYDPLPVANFDNAYFALFFSATEDGEYVALDASNGPVRLFDTTAGTHVKSIKNVATIIINPVIEEEIENPITIPTFSIDFVDGEDTITVTNTAFANVELVVFSNESKSVTTFYKGIKVSTFVASINELDNQTTITSLSVAAGDYSSELPASNFDTAYFALFFSATEDGEYVALDASNGPVRLFDTTEDTTVKSVKNVDTVTVNRS